MGHEKFPKSVRGKFLALENEVVNQGFLKNELIREYPTLRASPYNGDDTQAYTSFIAGPDTASLAMSEDVVDPITGRPMAKITIPALSTNYAGIDYLDLDEWQMNPDDVWMLCVYLPNRLNGGLNIQLLVTDSATFTGVEYRNVTFTADMLQKGFNILTCLHVEKTIGVSTFGEIGTTRNNEWVNNGQITDQSPSKSLRFRAKAIVGQGTDLDIYLGSVHTAPAGWAKGAVMWMADDVPNSFYELAIPVIESYGWKCALAVTSTYAANPGETYMPMNSVRDAYKKGHEVWGHLRRHEDMQAVTTAQKTRALKSSSDFWKSSGMNSASRFMAWPFGRYDDEAITIAKQQGYLLAASIRGEEINPIAAGCNPYYLNRLSVEVQNSWQVETMINGSVKRGRGVITYMHNAIPGGSDTDLYPGSTSFYVDHLKRWCDFLAKLESNGECVVTTPLEYLRLCGIDPYRDSLSE